jgi:hypothetical protein
MTAIEITFLIISTIIAFSGLVITCIQHRQNQTCPQVVIEPSIELAEAAALHVAEDERSESLSIGEGPEPPNVV